MTTATHPLAAEPIVCPPWCVEHFGSDPELGNPDRTYTHDSVSRTFEARAQFRGREPERFNVELSMLSREKGEPVEYGVGVWLAGEVLTVETARELGTFLVSLADQAEKS